MCLCVYVRGEQWGGGGTGEVERGVRRLMTSVVAAAPDRSRVLHRAYFLTAACLALPPAPTPTYSPARAQKANALHLATGARGADTYVCACVCFCLMVEPLSALTVSRTSKWFGEMAVSRCTWYPPHPPTPIMPIHPFHFPLGKHTSTHAHPKQTSKQTLPLPLILPIGLQQAAVPTTMIQPDTTE